MNRSCDGANGLWEKSTNWFRRASEGYRCIIVFLFSASLFIVVELMMNWLNGDYAWLDSYVDYYGAIAGSILALMGTTATGYIFLIEYSRLSELRSSSPWMMLKDEMKSVFRGLVVMSILSVVLNTAVAFRQLNGLIESCFILSISGLFVGLVGAFLVFDYDMVTADVRLNKSLGRFLAKIDMGSVQSEQSRSNKVGGVEGKETVANGMDGNDEYKVTDAGVGRGSSTKTECVESQRSGGGKGGREAGCNHAEVDGKIEEFCKRFIEVENLFYEFMGLPKDEVMLEGCDSGRHIPPFDEDSGFNDEVELRENFFSLRKTRDILVALTASGGWHVKGVNIDEEYADNLERLFEDFCRDLNKKLNGRTVDEVKLTNYKFDSGSKLGGCKFKNSTMNGCKFQGVVDMPGLSLECSTFSGNLCDTIAVRNADSVQFIQSRVSRLIFQKGSCEQDSGNMGSFNASDCTLQESTWNALKMERSKFMNSRIIKCKFLAIDFSQTMFDKSRLVEVIFDDCDLSASRFNGCSLIGCELVLTSQCDMRDCEVNGVLFDTSQVEGGTSVMSNCKIIGSQSSAYFKFGEVVATWQRNLITDVSISGVLKMSSINNCRFTYVRFEESSHGTKDSQCSCDTVDTFFENTTFINCEFKMRYSRTTFINCTFIGRHPDRLYDVSFIGCRFSTRDAAIPGAKIIDCVGIKRLNHHSRPSSSGGMSATYTRCIFGGSGPISASSI